MPKSNVGYWAISSNLGRKTDDSWPIFKILILLLLMLHCFHQGGYQTDQHQQHHHDQHADQLNSHPAERRLFVLTWLREDSKQRGRIWHSAPLHCAPDPILQYFLNVLIFIFLNFYVLFPLRCVCFWHSVIKNHLEGLDRPTPSYVVEYARAEKGKCNNDFLI